MLELRCSECRDKSVAWLVSLVGGVWLWSEVSQAIGKIQGAESGFVRGRSSLTAVVGTVGLEIFIYLQPSGQPYVRAYHQIPYATPSPVSNDSFEPSQPEQ